MHERKQVCCNEYDAVMYMRELCFEKTNKNWGLHPKAYYFKCNRQRCDFCEELTLWHFATMFAAVKSAKPWMSNHFSGSRDPSYVGSAMCPECPTKN